MAAQPPSHRERFIAAIEACLSLIEERHVREEAATRLELMRSPGSSHYDEAATVRRLAAAVRKTGTIDSDEAERLLALFMRNGERWPGEREKG